MSNPHLKAIIYTQNQNECKTQHLYLDPIYMAYIKTILNYTSYLDSFSFQYKDLNIKCKILILNQSVYTLFIRTLKLEEAIE